MESMWDFTGSQGLMDNPALTRLVQIRTPGHVDINIVSRLVLREDWETDKDLEFAIVA